MYVSYRIKTFDASAKSDLKNLATSLENFFEENHVYPADIPSGFQGNSNVTVVVSAVAIDSFTATAKHNASTNTWTYISNQGGIQ